MKGSWNTMAPTENGLSVDQVIAFEMDIVRETGNVGVVQVSLVEELDPVDEKGVAGEQNVEFPDEFSLGRSIVFVEPLEPLLARSVLLIKTVLVLIKELPPGSARLVSVLELFFLGHAQSHRHNVRVLGGDFLRAAVFISVRYRSGYHRRSVFGVALVDVVVVRFRRSIEMGKELPDHDFRLCETDEILWTTLAAPFIYIYIHIFFVHLTRNLRTQV